MYTLCAATEADFDFLYELHEAGLRDHVQAIWGWDDTVQRRMYREEVYLELVEIHPRAQRRGLGTAIVRSLLAEAAAARLPAALRVFEINVGARRLYQRLGFVIVGENETHYDMRCG